MPTLPDARERAAALDAIDPLAGRRELFLLPEGVAYFDGNSLGPLTRMSRAAVQAVVEHQWGVGLIRSWSQERWLGLPARTGERIAGLVGAPTGTLIATDTTSANLFKALTAALRLRPGRTRLVVDADNFPTDLYIARSVAALHDIEVVAVPAEGILDALDERVAAVTATHVDYRSARILDLAGITAAAHDVGALAVWDLAHTAGAVPCDVAGAGVDLAVGCGYKYLNGGPGAPAFVYATPEVQAEAEQPITGWFGHAEPFAFDPTFRPSKHIDRFLSGTTGVLGMASLHAALEAFDGVAMGELRAKSTSLTSLFVDLVTEVLTPKGFIVASPARAADRGSHVALSHPAGEQILAALTARGVLGDFRPPDRLRFGFAPLFNTHIEVVHLVEALLDICP